MTQNIVSKKRDNSGNLKTPLDPLRSLVAPYTFNGDIYGTAGAGKQAFTNANGRNLYIVGLYVKEQSGNAVDFQVYDGTIAAGTKLVDVGLAANGEPRMDYVLPIGPFTDTGGIYVRTTDATHKDIGIVVSVAVDPGVVE